MRTFGQVFLLFVYFVIGMMLAVPYLYLVGSNWDYFVLIAIIAPFVVFVLWTLGKLSGAIQTGSANKYRKKHNAFPRFLFWITLLYVLLPIILNGLSKLLLMFEYTNIANFFFTYRFMSVNAILFIGLVGIVVFKKVTVSRKWINKYF